MGRLSVATRPSLSAISTRSSRSTHDTVTLVTAGSAARAKPSTRVTSGSFRSMPTSAHGTFTV
jgi:hypothetical protein